MASKTFLRNCNCAHCKQKLQQIDAIDNARIDSQEDIAQLRANINLKKLDAQGKGPGFQYKNAK